MLIGDDGEFGEAAAESYDDEASAMFLPSVVDPAVDFLADLAAGRRVVEFAIGTGRIALPLAARGVEVVGIDRSPAMLDRLRSKPGGDDVSVVVGDMATTRLPGSFGLVYLVFNTITNLLTQQEQVACFQNAADHLEPGGAFVIETFVPALRRLPPGERFVVFDVSDDHVGVDEYDVAASTLRSHHHRASGRSSTTHRFAWPAEYDLMARMAGLVLQERWAGWDRSPFTAESGSHVSVWEKPT